MIRVDACRRVYGIESELGTQVGSKRLAADNQPALGNDFVANLLDHDPNLYTVGQAGFMSNGARLYTDVGGHVEYATPECTSLRDIVAAQIAAEELLTDLVAVENQRRATHAKTVERAKNAKVYLNNRVCDQTGETWGSHENYLIPRDHAISEDYFAVPLVSHLATRPVLAGAGAILQLNGQMHYLVSQRLRYLQCAVGEATTRDRPYISLRDEPHADAKKYRRLHVISGEPTMSPWATAYRLGSTSLVLSMIEQDKFPRQLYIYEPERAGKLVARDRAFVNKIPLELGKPIRPVEFQLRLAEHCLKLVHNGKLNVSFDEAVIAQEWYDAADALAQAGAWEVLADRVDGAAKLACVTSQAAKQPDGRAAKERAIKVDHYWGELSPRGLARILRRHGAFRDPLDAMSLYPEYMHNAPPGRAKFRGEAIRALSLMGVQSDAAVDWSAIKIGNKILPLTDPFDASVKVRKRFNAIIGSV